MATTMNSHDVVTCPRCGGGGWISEFKHIEDGICFQRRGDGVIDRPTTKQKPVYSSNNDILYRVDWDNGTPLIQFDPVQQI